MLIPNQPTISSRCASQACLEVTLTDRVQVRDTKPDGAAVVFTTEAWRSFAAALKNEGLTEEKSNG